MSGKEYLTQLERLQELIEAEETDLKNYAELESDFAFPARGKKLYQRMIEDQRKTIQSQKDFYPTLEDMISSKIQELRLPKEKKVLTMKYIAGEDWPSIFGSVEGSEDSIFAIHKRGLKHLEKLIDNI
ncbi:MAG: hypothetical protein IJ188_08980 [Clostridia bacterium]|nr:hypothetical protein [Clostridia bacterium]